MPSALFRDGAAGQAVGMDETDILSRIHSLVDEEHKLREGNDHSDDEKARLNKIDADLDQCWDLLRQRRAKRQYGENPDDAHVRSAQTVEHYQQ